MGAHEIEAFLSYLATERDVSASTQNQALSAVLFLYKEVLEVQLPWLDGVTRARKPLVNSPLSIYDEAIVYRSSPHASRIRRNPEKHRYPHHAHRAVADRG